MSPREKFAYFKLGNDLEQFYSPEKNETDHREIRKLRVGGNSYLIIIIEMRINVFFLITLQLWKNLTLNYSSIPRTLANGRNIINSYLMVIYVNSY